MFYNKFQYTDNFIFIIKVSFNLKYVVYIIYYNYLK